MPTGADLPPTPRNGEPVPEINCGAGVVEFLSRLYERLSGLSVAPGPSGVAARAVFGAVDSGAVFVDSLVDAAEELRTNEELKS